MDASGSGDYDTASPPAGLHDKAAATSPPAGCNDKAAATSPPVDAAADPDEEPQPAGSSAHVDDPPPHVGGGASDHYAPPLAGGATTDTRKPPPVRRRAGAAAKPPPARHVDNDEDVSALADRASSAFIILALVGGVTAADTAPTTSSGAEDDDHGRPAAGTRADVFNDGPVLGWGDEAASMTHRVDSGGTGVRVPPLSGGKADADEAAPPPRDGADNGKKASGCGRLEERFY